MKDKTQRSSLSLLVGLLIFLVACGGVAEPTPEPPTPTIIPATAVPEPTSTSEPVAANETETEDEVESPDAEPAVATRPGSPPYLDPALPLEERIDDLLDRMSLEEKIGQMTLVEKDSIRPGDVTRYEIGALLSGGGGSPPDNSPEGWLEMVTGYQEAALATELGIPLLYGVDAVHGHNNLLGATIFPHNIGLGATRNPELIRAIARATAVETIATGIHWDYAPVLAVPRDIRWGRAYEGYAENTELVTELATAFLIGLQGLEEAPDLAHPQTILGTPKHFVGDGGTEWGSSTTDNFIIDQGVTNIDEATLREVHLSPYPPAIEAGALSIMVSYSSWGGVKMHAQQYLITDVLKGELGFEGFVVSDWKAIDQIDPGDYYASVVAAINAGIDMNMVPYDYTNFVRVMERAVREGDISEERVDDAVRRILRAKFALGLFEAPFGDPALLETIGSADHRALARQAVRESAVLLQNRDSTLPLDRSADQRIFVSGLAADDVGLQSGGWTIEWQGVSGRDIPGGVSILDGIEAAATPGSEIIYDRFGKFESTVDERGDLLMGDIGIVVIGERPYAEGYGDNDDLSINTTLIERMAERTDRVVVIIISGRPLIITEALDLADVWIAAWLPGSQGDGLAELLFGDYPFTGKLSFTWPRSVDQLPFNFPNIPNSGCAAPLFPYGFGLSADIDTETESDQAWGIVDCE